MKPGYSLCTYILSVPLFADEKPPRDDGKTYWNARHNVTIEDSVERTYIVEIAATTHCNDEPPQK